MRSDIVRDYHYFGAGTCRPRKRRLVMAMREVVHFPKRMSREFVKNLAWMLGGFGALGVILVFATHLPLLGGGGLRWRLRVRHGGDGHGGGALERRARRAVPQWPQPPPGGVS